MEPSELPNLDQTQRSPLSRNDLIGELIVVLCLGVLTHLVSAVSSLVDGATREWPVWLTYVTGIAMSIQVAVPVAWIMYRSDKPLSEFGIKPVRYKQDIGLTACVFVCTWLAVVFSRTLLTAAWNMPMVADALNMIPGKVAPSWQAAPQGVAEISLFLGFDIASGFAEELVVRCYLITRLTQLLGGQWRAVMCAAAIMASYHLYQGSYAVTEIFLSEIGVGALWLAIPRLWPFAIGHALYNASLMAMYST